MAQAGSAGVARVAHTPRLCNLRKRAFGAERPNLPPAPDEIRNVADMKTNGDTRSVVAGASGKTLPAPSKLSSVAEPSRLPDRIYELILHQIVSGKFSIGDRLPSENQMGAEHKVSRAVVREALSRLLAGGVVTTRQGAGTFVHRKPGREFLRLAPLGGIADLMRCFEFRIALEGEAALLAAQRRTDENLEAMSAAFERLDEANAKGEL